MKNKTLTIVGLGNRDGDLTMRGLTAIQNAQCVIAKTLLSDAAKGLKGLAANVMTCDDLFDLSQDFDELNQRIADRVHSAMQQNDKVVFCVNGSGSDDTTVKLLAKSFALDYISGVSVNECVLHYANSNRFMSVSATELGTCRMIQTPIIVREIDNKLLCGQVKLLLSRYVGDATDVILFDGQKIHMYKLFEIDRHKKWSFNSTLLVNDVALTKRQRHDVDSLLEILDVLRSPDGCKWDREQTNLSICSSTLEEAYELVDAIHSGDNDSILEEIGDLLLQGFFHTKIIMDDGGFDYVDVFTALCAKLITRHTHIFGQDVALDAAEAISVWEQNKKIEKGYQTAADTLTSVPKSMSALMRAYKVCNRASKANFDWRHTQGVLEKLNEELQELQQAIKQGDISHISSEIGDVLFVLCNLCRFVSVDPEIALNGTIKKFIGRFAIMEQLLAADGLSLQNTTDEVINQYYLKAKNQWDMKG